MCGIVGARHDWLRQHGLSPEPTLRAAVADLGWRGPDGQAVAAAGPWLLGCARLAITRPASRQPLTLRGERYTGVMNGAVTNARELWAELLPGAERRPAPPNDAWLPLLAVARQRLDLLTGLRGHHAYAVVDRATGELVLGQDRYAEKPLHCLVARVGATWQLVAFASTPGALRRLGMPAVHAPRRLAEWFRFGWAPARRHRFSSRLRLEQVPRLGVPLRTAAGARSWCRPLAVADRPAAAAGPADPDLRARLVAGVGRCADTTVAAGLSLSGGIDSSCLALALGRLGRHLPAYQFQAAGSARAERDAAAAVAAVAGLPLRPVTGGPELLDALPHLTRLAGEPLGDPSILAVHAVGRAAAADGIRVLLGGEGADELLLGYRRYLALAKLPRLPWLHTMAPRWSMRYLARWWRAVVAPNPVRALLAVTPPAFGVAVLSPQLARRRCWRDAQQLAGPGSNLALAAREDDLAGYLRRDLLPKVDIGLMAAGIESRCPYLEAGIEGAGADLQGLAKRALRAAFAAELPAAVRRLPKRGFAVPLDEWFRGDTPWLDVLAEPRSRSREHLCPGGISRAIDRHRRGRADLGHGIYLLLACELHLRALEADDPTASAR